MTRASAWRALGAGSVVAMVLCASGCGSDARPEAAIVEGAQGADAALRMLLEEVLGGTTVPGGVAAIARVGEPLRIGAFGVRRSGSDVPFDVDDLVHIGSDTKAMTAALVGRYVDRGELSFDTTLAEALPAVAAEADPSFRTKTVLDLLRHTAGLPANADDWGAHRDLDLRARRRAITADALGSGPAGDGFLYSNLGVMIAGAIVEEVAGDGALTWEELLRREVCAPLGMASVGFGAPGTPGELDQPWGHKRLGEAALALQVDNDPALGPAGTVHLSMADWARFVLVFTDGGAAAVPGFLSAETRARLLEPGLDGYAAGWSVGERDWADGIALTHAGSNTTWFAVAWVAPRQDRAFLVAVNAAGRDTAALVDRVVEALIALDGSRTTAPK